MFIGRYYYTLESQGRVSLPKSYRAQVDESQDWIVTRGLDGGLFIFKAVDFEKKIAELAGRTFTKKQHRDFIRLMTNDAYAVKTDANGRVQLPEYLIMMAQLKKDVVVVGSFEYIELWDKDAYHHYLDELTPQAAAISESLSYEPKS